MLLKPILLPWSTECNGNANILVSENNIQLRAIYQMLNIEFGVQGYKTSTLLSLLLHWVLSKFNGEMSLIYPSIGRRMMFVNDDTINELGIQQ